MIQVEKLFAYTEEADFKQKIQLPRNFLFYYMLIGMVIGLYITSHPILMKILWTMVIIFMIAELYVSFISKKIEIMVKPLPKVLHKGEHISLELTVKNLSRFPLSYTYFCLKESYSLVPQDMIGLCVTLSPRSSQTFRIPYEVVHSGMDEVGIEQVVWMDYLEIARRKKSCDLQQVILLPRLQSLKGQEVFTNVFANEKIDQPEKAQEGKQFSQIEGEVGYELEPYEEGASERLMHWKLVAQRELYQVRKREQFMKSAKAYRMIMEPFWITEGEEEKRADLIDQMITIYGSYLYSLIQQGEKVYWMGYHKGKWEERRIESTIDFYDIQEILCSGYVASNLEEKKGWLQLAGDASIEKILLTTHLEEALKSELEQENFKIIWLQEEV